MRLRLLAVTSASALLLGALPATGVAPAPTTAPVASAAPAPPTVVVDRAPLATLSTAGAADSINDVAIGADGRLYVADDTTVSVYAAGASGTAAPRAVLEVPGGEGEEALLVTVDDDGFVTVLTGDPSGAGPRRLVVLTGAGAVTRDVAVADLGIGAAVAISALGDEVAVVDIDTNGVEVFALRDGATAPTRSIPGGADTTTLVNPYLVAAGPGGRLVVAGFQTYGSEDVGRVSVFGPGADGPAARPQRLLEGTRTRLGSRPTDLAVDRTGAVVVATADVDGLGRLVRPRVVRFAPTATGNSAPTAVLQGPKARLGQVTSVDVARDGTLRTVPFAIDADTAAATGGSVVRTHRALGPYAVPSAPRALKLVGTSRRRTLSWQPARTNPDTPVRVYQLRTRCGRAVSGTAVAPGKRRLVVRLQPGRCTVTLRAVNVIGTGPAATVRRVVKR